MMSLKAVESIPNNVNANISQEGNTPTEVAADTEIIPKKLKITSPSPNHPEEKVIEEEQPGHSKYYSSLTILQPSNNSLWRLPELCVVFYEKLIEDNIIEKGDVMIFNFSEQGAFDDGHHLPISIANQFITMAKKYGYSVSNEFYIEFNGKHLLVINQIDDLMYLRKDLLNQLEKDGLISNKNKRMEMEIYGNSFSVNGKEIPNSKLANYFDLFNKYNVIPAPGKTIETDTKKGIIHVGYSKDGSRFGSMETF